MKGVIYMTKSKRQRIREKRLKARIRTHNKLATAANARLYWTKYKRLISFDRTYARCMCPNKLYFGPLPIKYPNRKRVRQLAKCLKQGMHYRARIPKRFLYEYKTPVMINHRSTYCSIFGGEITND